MSDFPRYLRELLHARGWGIEAFAREYAIPRRSLYKWLAGEAQPRSVSTLLLIEALQADPREFRAALMSGDGPAADARRDRARIGALPPDAFPPD